MSLDAMIGAFADAVADRVVRKLLTGQAGDWVDQAQSPAGRRRHCALVRARIARGEPGAAIVGRRHLLSRAALEAELARNAPASSSDHGGDELAAYRKKRRTA